MAKDDMTGLLVLGGLGVAAYVLYSNGTLASWFPSLFPATTYKGVTLLPSSVASVSLQESKIDQLLANGMTVTEIQALLNGITRAQQTCGPSWDPTQATCVASEPTSNIPVVSGPPPGSGPGTGTAVAAPPPPTPGSSGFPGANCTIGPTCAPGQMCAQYRVLGQLDQNGVCKPLTVPLPQASNGSVLTVQDAATFPYSSSVTAAQMNAIHAQLVSNFDAGQIPVIAGNSVLAYMLGWGGQAAGATETVNGESYSFDGANWHLSTSGLSGFASTRVGMGWIHGGLDYRFRRAS